MQDMGAWQFERRKGMPRSVQIVYDRIQDITDTGEEGDFTDFDCREIRIPVRAGDGKRYFAAGYAEALWEFRHRRLVLERLPGDRGTVLFRRDIDEMNGEPLDTWHAIGSIADEYNVPRTERSQAFETLFQRECRRLTTDEGVPLRVVHGIKFTDRAYWVDDDGRGRQNIILTDDPADPILRMPFELDMGQEFNPHLADTADGFITWLCADDASRNNMRLLAASPFLQKYKHLSFVLAGDGGNGKGVFFGAFSKHNDQTARLSCTIDAEKLAGGSRLSGTSLEQEPAKLIGKLWAFDEDASGLDQHQTDRLKRISTGDRIDSRTLGRDVVSFNPRATLCIATNLDFVTNMDRSMRRRFAFVRLVDGRKPDEQKMVNFRIFCATSGAAGFIMASCRYWLEHPDGIVRDVQLNRAEHMSDAEEWVVAEILQHGFAVNTQNPFLRGNDTHAVSRLKEKLGLESVRRSDKWVLKVANTAQARTRFEPFAEWVKTRFEEDGNTTPPEPLDPQPSSLNPDEYGFHCDYTPARPDKVAVNWKRTVEDPNVDTSRPPEDARAWACVPADGYAVLDFDMAAHEGEPSGWARMCTDLGDYGSLAFPRTYLTRTPSGGVHAYYRLPQGVVLKNAAHPQGMPIDIRTERKGYVIAPGSVTDAGRYTVADDAKVCELSGPMVAWLTAHGYVDTPEPVPAAVSPAPQDSALPVGPDGVIAGVDPVTGEILTPFTRGYSDNPLSANRGEAIRLNPPVQSPGMTHQPVLEWSYGLLQRAREQAWTQPEVDALVQRILDNVRPGHDPQDTSLIVRGALDKAGLSTTIPLPRR
ncbi:hypothetical protein BAAM0483_04950 [Bifidobacterium animalis subsp. animalis MCC 0483]|uniref:DNA primase/polymerase bifunctional N-terminal domain-containing protein n=1 Tax=Bifidobacterium animalis subsp. animalis MCC 0483 TaxID=1365955 RepID=A0AB34T8J7_9BIFI|nr:bifunctional DNA primase/polymerase [Bifidobacterium animalis]KOA49496.1 hypothetical protein BAAM0483_04950 [Bifidobacterium animalis subsp. animalis MCC 0483]